jgi:hypothetical protein
VWFARGGASRLDGSALHEPEKEDPEMEQRQTRRGPAWPGGRARGSGRRALPWLGLVVVLSTIVYGLHVAAASSSPGAGSAAGTATAALAAASDTAGSHWVTLTYVGANGRQSRLHCLTTSDRLAGDMLFADPEEMLTLAFEVCQSMRDEAGNAPVRVPDDRPT